MNFKRFVVGPVKYCFVDFDQTLRESAGTEAPQTLEEVKVFPWAHQRLQEARDKGYCVIGITNQSRLVEKIGVEAVDAICKETLRQLNFEFPYFFAHTREQSKPNIYMIEQAQLKYGQVDKTKSIMVGDDVQKDGGIAKNFGIRFIPVDDFRTVGVP